MRSRPAPSTALPRATARVLRRCAALLLAVSPWAGAQSLAPEPAPRLDGETRVLPVWSNASGRFEALLLLDPIEAPRTSALDRVLSATTPTLGLGGRIELDGGSRVHGALQLEGDGSLALLCEGRRGLAGALGSLGERCLLATLAPDDPLLVGRTQGARFGLGWESAQGDVDFSFGLSWLEHAPPLATLAPSFVSTLYLPGDSLTGWNSRLESRGLHLDSLINLGPQARMLLGGDLGRSRVRGADGTELNFESAALSLGIGIGDFSGQLTGRLIELPRDGSQWSTLDIGVSWRTPWRGELSVGARNVLGNGEPRWPMTELPAIEDSDSRVPYVRYQQDL